MILYRAEIVNWGDEDTNQFIIKYREHYTIKETEKSYIIRIGMKQKVIGKNNKKKYANTTKELALQDLKCRTKVSLILSKRWFNYADEKLKFLKTL